MYWVVSDLPPSKFPMGSRKRSTDISGHRSSAWCPPCSDRLKIEIATQTHCPGCSEILWISRVRPLVHTHLLNSTGPTRSLSWDDCTRGREKCVIWEWAHLSWELCVCTLHDVRNFRCTWPKASAAEVKQEVRCWTMSDLHASFPVRMRVTNVQMSTKCCLVTYLWNKELLFIS